MQAVIDAALDERDNGHARWNRVKRACAQFLGYGEADWARGSVCTDQRVIMLGCGRLNASETHAYDVPLPPTLNAQRVSRRMTISLAWFTPINTRHRSYRVADLWFDPPLDQLRLKRRDVDHNAATRGTIQHEILEGDQAVPIAQGDTAPIQVNCRLEAGSALPEMSPYAIVVTLETATPLSVSVYDQVKIALERIAMLRVSDLLLKGAVQIGEREQRWLSNARKNYIRTHLDWDGRPAEVGAEHSAGGAWRCLITRMRDWQESTSG